MPLDLAADALGVAAELLERLLDFEKRLQLLLETGGGVDLLRQVLEQRADALSFLERLRDLALDLLAVAGQAFGLLVQRLEPAGHFLEVGEALLEIAELRGHALDVGGGAADGIAQFRRAGRRPPGRPG